MSTRAQPNQVNAHVPNLTCTCVECTRDHLKGCRKPNKCKKEALLRINKIVPRFNPLIGLSQCNDFSLTPTHKARRRAANENSDKILFDTKIACKMDDEQHVLTSGKVTGLS